MEMELMQMAYNYGFAGVISIYTLVSITKAVKENTKAINELRIKIASIS